jgi:hypothetical protein
VGPPAGAPHGLQSIEHGGQPRQIDGAISRSRLNRTSSSIPRSVSPSRPLTDRTGALFRSEPL